MVDLTGKTALVTGASRGIGRAIALGYAAAGAAVIVSSRKTEGVQAVADEIRALGGRAHSVAAHVGQESAVAALVAEAVEAFGGLDLVVNNAATNPHFGALLDASDSMWDKILEVNLKGPFHVIRHAVPHLRARGGGLILNVASVAGLRPSPAMGVYSVSKAALLMLTRALAVELGPDRIRVNALAPGLIRTRFSQALWETPEIAERAIAATPLGRLGEVEDLVGAALFLASPQAAYITGAVLTLDGGLNETGGLG